MTETGSHIVKARLDLTLLSQALKRLEDDDMSPAQFSALARQQDELLSHLPDRYAQVLATVLDRLEASALFVEESCSFSHSDLIAQLKIWIEKAGEQLPAA